MTKLENSKNNLVGWPHCQFSQKLRQCPQFFKMNPGKRYDALESLKIYFNSTRKHFLTKCHSENSCSNGGNPAFLYSTSPVLRCMPVSDTVKLVSPHSPIVEPIPNRIVVIKVPNILRFNAQTANADSYTAQFPKTSSLTLLPTAIVLFQDNTNYFPTC